MRLAGLLLACDGADHPSGGIDWVGDVWLAQGFFDRLFGIFATPDDRPLLLGNCSWVHGFGLRAPLFLTFLNRHGVVVNNGIALKPWATASDARASHVLESCVPLAIPIGSRLIWGTPQTRYLD